MRPLLPLLTGLLMTISLLSPAPAAEPERTPGGMLRSTLPNGMQLLIIENHAAPIAVVNTWFMVGARNEQPVDEGISHFLEHMLFDGSEGMPLEEINRHLFREGIDNNASTDQDNTNYFHVGPASKLRETARMTAMLVMKPLLLDSQFDREREVVKEELRQGLDNPDFFLGDLVLPAAMQHTGYDHPVIGSAEILDGQTNDQMRQYYRNYYGPNNAFTLAIGDFDANEALQILTEEYGPWEPTEIAPMPEVRAFEQTEPRSIVGSRDFATNYIAAVWPTVPASAPDTYALQVLATLLGQGDASVLVRKLRDDLGLVSDISTYAQELDDQSVFWLNAEMVDPEKTTEATNEIFKAMREFADKGPSIEAVERAKRKLILANLFLGEDVQGQAYQLGYFINATGSPTWFEDYSKRLAGVTAEDVQYCAQTYLIPEHITLGLATPDATAPALSPDWDQLHAKGKTIPRPADMGRLGSDDSPIYPASVSGGERASAASADARTLANGIEVRIMPVPGTGTAGITIATRHGLDLESWDTNGTGALLERTIVKGTTTRSADDISGLIDELGGMTGVAVGVDSATVSGLYDVSDLDRAIPLLADLVANATYPESEFLNARDILLAEIAARADESYPTTHDQLAYAMWGQDAAYGRPPLGRPSVVSALTRDQVADFATRLFDPSQLVIAVAGDVEADALFAHLDAAFGQREAKSERAIEPAAVATREITPAVSLQRIVNSTGKAQTMSVLGLPGLSLTHPDLPAVQAVDMILGGSWLSRLFDRLRGKEGLAYGTYSRVEAYREGGAITARIGTRPEMWEQAITGLQREFRLVATGDFTEEDLVAAKAYTRWTLVQSHAGMLAQSQHLASNIALGLAPDHEWQVLEKLEAVTLDEAKRVAAQYYSPTNAWLAVTGDLFAEAAPLQ